MPFGMHGVRHAFNLTLFNEMAAQDTARQQPGLRLRRFGSASERGQQGENEGEGEAHEKLRNQKGTGHHKGEVIGII